MTYQGFFFSIPEGLQTAVRNRSDEISWESIDSFEKINELTDPFVICFHQSFNLVEHQDLFASLQKKPNALIVYFLPPLDELAGIDSSRIYKVPEHADELELNLLIKFLLEDLNISSPDEMQQLTTEYKASVFAKIANLFNLAQSWPDNLDPLKKAIHKLAGSAGSYGFSKVTKLCKQFETELTTALESNAPPEKDLVIQKCLDIKEGFLDRATPPLKDAQEPPFVKNTPSTLSTSDSIFSIYCIDDDIDLLKQLEVEGKKHPAFHIEYESNFDTAKNRLSDPNFSINILMIDLVNNNGSISGYDLINTFQASNKNPSATFILIFSSQGSFNARHEASSLGIDFYFHKPLQPSYLFQQLEKYQTISLSEKYKLLLIDDDESFCKNVQLQLENSRFSVEYLTDHTVFFETLTKIRPDVIVLDIKFSNGNGLDILKTIKADSAFRRLCVIMLTSSDDTELLKTAFSLGADYFLNKPISENGFSTILDNIVKRRKVSAAFADRNPFIGTFTHEAIEKFFNIYSLNYRNFCVIFFKIFSTNDTDLDAKELKQFSDSISHFFSDKDILGSWGNNLFVLLTVQLEKDSLRNLISDFFSFLQKENFTQTSALAVNAFISAFPFEGTSLDSLMKISSKALSEISPTNCWEIRFSSESTYSKQLPLENSVYVISNDEKLYFLVEYALSLRGISSICEPNGSKALTDLKNTFMQAPPLSILLDDNTEEEDPILILEGLKKIISNRVPIIFISAKHKESDIYESLESGASSFIPKPFSMSLLLHKIIEKKL